MNEKTLLKLALVCIVVGLIGLYFISGRISVEEKDISRITYADAEKDVKVSGIISKVENRGNITVVEITQPTKIQVVLFETDLDIAEGSNVDVYGTVEEFNGRMELIGNVIRLR